MNQRWLLPEQLEDLLPREAWALESARRALLDLFYSRGYELVAPPALEYMESLLTGSGQDADLSPSRWWISSPDGCLACVPTSRRRWRASTRIAWTALASAA